jgi:hypothetical protein
LTIVLSFDPEALDGFKAQAAKDSKLFGLLIFYIMSARVALSEA